MVWSTDVRMQPQYIRSFKAVARPDARVLILGSIPGEESLRQRQYYAHPQNQFWRLMQILVGAGRNLAYPERLEKLQACSIALWDVVHSCQRPGSMDENILHPTVTPNNFSALFRRTPGLRLICFNGRKAAELFTRMVCPQLGHRLDAVARVTLPSTSPAHATLTFNQKCARWRKALKPVLDGKAGLPRPAEQIT